MILYKYANAASGIKILQRLQLKVSPPCEFNDPFELTPCSTSGIKRIYKEAAKEGFCGSFEDFRICYKTVAPHRAKEIKQFRSEASDADLYSVISASKRLAILCFSEPNDSALLWAHYADMH